MSAIAFRAKNLLESGEVTPGTFRENGGIIDLGRAAPPKLRTEDIETAETPKAFNPLTRAQRERLPDRMAAQLMDHYMSPEALNNQHDVNPLRDGLPTCAKHPFNRSKGQYGCIHSCGARDPNMVRPVEKDITVYDVFQWVRGLVRISVKSAEMAKGWRRPTDLTTR